METDELKILAIDDNQDNLAPLKAVIANAFPGARVFAALNGQTGAESALAEAPDVILLDTVMTGMDGFEVCRNLKQDEHLKDIPVVFLTGLKTDRESRIKALEAGAEGFLSKPLDEQELAAQIRAMAKIKAASIAQREVQEQLVSLVAKRTGELEQELAKRTLVEEARNESEVRYRRLFETAKDGILILDAETGMIVDVNPFLIEMLDYSHEQFLGKTVWELGFFKDVIANLDNFLELQRQEYIRYEDLPLETAAGRRINVEFVSNVYLVDGKKVIQCNIREITARRRAEEALRANATLLRIAGHTARLGGWIVNLAENRVIWSDEVAAIHEMPAGYSPTVEEGTDFYTPEWKEKIKEVFSACAREGKPYDEEMEIVTARGRRIWVRTIGEAIHDESGAITRIQGAFQDITERKQVEQVLAESENRYRNLMMHSPDAILVNLQDRVLLVNHACMKLFGAQSVEELIGKSLYDLFHPDVHKQIRERLERLCDRGEPVPPLAEKIVRLDGAMVEVDLVAAPFTVGGLTAIHIILRDITERKRIEAEHERLMSAIEQAGEAVIITDPAGTIQYVNPAFATATGYTREEALGQSTRILKSGKQDEEYYRKMWQTIASGKTWKGRIVNKRKDGGLYTEEATISPVFGAAGQVVNYVAVKRDITEHLRLEAQFQQAQKMESVGRLAGGVAHDFNNMLSVILGFTEMAISQVDPSQPLYGNLQEVLKAAGRAADITKQLLTFARKQTIAPKVLDLNTAIEGMLKMLRRLIGEDIDLAWLPKAGLWPIEMDPSQLNQILANLCVNARDAIADVGKIIIETGIAAFDGAYCANHAGFIPGEYSLLAVSDDGDGMDKETLGKIFEPFFTTKGAGQGTGLGLATVYGIVKQNKGFINVYSEPGKGTTLKIYLPRHMGQCAEILAKTAVDIPHSRGETVLVVEDEFSILEIACELLTGLGYTVLTAGTPGQAMRLIEEHTGEIHLLLTDVVLPEMNGRDLAGQLQAIRPAMKCLFMSGYTADAIAHRGVLDDGVQFIQKPFSLQNLAAKLREVLDRQ